MHRAIFLDRDGVLNELINRNDGFYSPRKLSDFKISIDSPNFTKKTSSLGFLNIIISNQPDISRGFLSEKILEEMTDLLRSNLKIDDVFYCTHDDSDSCSCRKPLAGLIFDAASKWDVDLSKSYFIGDSWKDIDAAKNANINFFLLDRSYNKDYDCDSRIMSLQDMFQLIG